MLIYGYKGKRLKIKVKKIEMPQGTNGEVFVL